jgi:hypothetical protein
MGLGSEPGLVPNIGLVSGDGVMVSETKALGGTVACDCVSAAVQDASKNTRMNKKNTATALGIINLIISDLSS